VLRDWELDENAVNRGIIIEAGNLFDEFGFGDGGRIMEKFAVYSCLKQVLA
jgi:hypothetical protein